MKAILGIDIAKLSFDIALLIEKKVYCKNLPTIKVASIN